VERSIFAPIRHTWLVFAAETKRLAAYRAQFWFELILSSAVELLVALAVWRAVFASSESKIIGGYSLEFMILYLTVAIFFGQATKGTGVGTFQREVYEGGLTKYLIYPLSVYSYKFGTFVPRSLFAVLQLSVALGILYSLGYWPHDFSLNPFWVFSGILSLFFACLLYFYLIILLECAAFWVDNVWALSYALSISITFLSGKVIPLELFPDWARSLIHFLPFPFLAYFPSQVFLGQLSFAQFASGFAVLCCWVVGIFFLSKFAMQRGFYQYSGVGQ
jgi:ABC-2 type transport system permease protein